LNKTPRRYLNVVANYAKFAVLHFLPPSTTTSAVSKLSGCLIGLKKATKAGLFLKNAHKIKRTIMTYTYSGRLSAIETFHLKSPHLHLYTA